jgi:hypothetical protein
MAEHQRPGGGTTQDIAGVAGGSREEDRDRGIDITPPRRRGTANDRGRRMKRDPEFAPSSDTDTSATRNVDSTTDEQFKKNDL